MTKEEQLCFMELQARVAELSDRVKRLEVDMVHVQSGLADVPAFEDLRTFAIRNKISLDLLTGD